MRLSADACSAGCFLRPAGLPAVNLLHRRVFGVFGATVFELTTAAVGTLHVRVPIAEASSCRVQILSLPGLQIPLLRAFVAGPHLARTVRVPASYCRRLGALWIFVFAAVAVCNTPLGTPVQHPLQSHSCGVHNGQCVTVWSRAMVTGGLGAQRQAVGHACGVSPGGGGTQIQRPL